MTDTERRAPARRSSQLSIAPLFARETDTVPRHELPEGEMAPDVAYQVIHDELMLDGNARLNLATFVSTWMEPQASTLMAECADKNMIDKDEYPQTAEIETALRRDPRRPLARPERDRTTPPGARRPARARHACSAGWRSSDAGRRRRAAEGNGGRQAQPGDGRQRPGVLGEVLPLLGRRAAPRPDGRRPLPPVRRGGRDACDENTIGVVAILGSTFDGCYEPVEEICAALDQFAADDGPRHARCTSTGPPAP